MAHIKTEVAVLGAGPGGYPAAIRAAQHGKKSLLIESNLLGGTCLNYGCIPTKALLASSILYKKITQAETFGIDVASPIIRWEKVVERKNAIVKSLQRGLKSVIASNGITLIKGVGTLKSPHHIEVIGDESTTVEADHIIIATGSDVKSIGSIPFDGKIVHNSTTILDLHEVPSSISIIGAGAIGCEFAALFSDLGAQVTMIEALPRILPNECSLATAYLAEALAKKGVKIVCGQKVVRYEQRSSSGMLELENGTSIESSIVLLAVGRSLNTSRIGLEEIGVSMKNGVILTNDHMMTNLESIYAVGDVTARAMCAHVATHQALVAVDNIVGKASKMYYNAIPSVVYTTPEYASVGMHLEEAKKQGFQVVVGKFPFQALGKALATGIEDGFSQVILEKETGRILGAQIVGDKAGDLIAEMTLALTNELTDECVTQTIHAHPTLSECWPEAIFVGNGEPLNVTAQIPLLRRGI